MISINKWIPHDEDARNRLENSLFFVVLIATSCFLFWKCRYGFGNIDESFYLTIPYRLYMGDGLFLEEWHLSQMSGLLTLPAVALFLEITGSTEGLLLAMRYICTLAQCVTAVFLYLRLKQINWLGAAITTISFVLYTPFGIMALSYNSMGILFLVLSQVILLTARKHVGIQYAFAGLSFAAAVLCCPYLLSVYVLYLAVIAVLFVRGRKSGVAAPDSPWSVKSAVCFTAGAAFAAAVFAVFVLSRASLSGIIKAFSYIFDDPEHGSMPAFRKFCHFFDVIIHANEYTMPIYCVLAALGVLCLADKKRMQHKLIYTGSVTVCILMLMLSLFLVNRYINHLMWSVNLFAPFLLLLSRDSRIRKLFVLLWIPGIMYAYCLNMTSNQEFYAISSASSVATVGSLMMLTLYLKELISEDHRILGKQIVACGLCCVFLGQLSTQGFMRYRSVFRDGGIPSLTVQADSGVEKGVRMTPVAFERYAESLSIAEKLAEYDKDKVLYLSMNTWYYLLSDQEMCTYSAWMSGVDEHSLYRLAGYYEINPHKLPQIVYAEAQYAEIAEAFCQQFGYEMQTINEGIILLPE